MVALSVLTSEREKDKGTMQGEECRREELLADPSCLPFGQQIPAVWCFKIASSRVFWKGSSLSFSAGHQERVKMTLLVIAILQENKHLLLIRSVSQHKGRCGGDGILTPRMLRGSFSKKGGKLSKWPVPRLPFYLLLVEWVLLVEWSRLVWVESSVKHSEETLEVDSDPYQSERETDMRRSYNWGT